MPDLPSPKQPQPERLKDWYPYYAGFTSDFAIAVIKTYMADAKSILDPWNGSGTTTAAAAELGLHAVGIDINPALGVIARARLTPASIADSLVPIATEITEQAWRETPFERSEEPLDAWFIPSSSVRFRRIQAAIHTITSEDDALERELGRRGYALAHELPVMTSFFYSALFAAARDLLHPFRSSNPTWLKYPGSPSHRLRPSGDAVGGAFVSRARYLAERLRIERSETTTSPDLVTGRAELPADGAGSYDACLTSPPYATRIDYIRGSMPELSVLGVGAREVARLRELSAGTPVVRGVAREERLPVTAARLVAEVAEHPSHGSSNYYAPWLAKYFGQLDDSIGRIVGQVRSGGRIGLVVQDSHYKTLRIDLQAVVAESFKNRGLECLERQDFKVHHTMSNMNTKARRHLPVRNNTESLLVFA